MTLRLNRRHFLGTAGAATAWAKEPGDFFYGTFGQRMRCCLVQTSGDNEEEDHHTDQGHRRKQWPEPICLHD